MASFLISIVVVPEKLVEIVQEAVVFATIVKALEIESAVAVAGLARVLSLLLK